MDALEFNAVISAALGAAPTAHKAFGGLSRGHKREYVRWVTEAKKADTRGARVKKTVAMLAHWARSPKERGGGTWRN